MPTLLAWLATGAATAFGIGFGLSGYDLAILSLRTTVGAGAAILASLGSFGIATSLALVPCVVLAALGALRFRGSAPAEVLGAARRAISGPLLVGATIGLLAYAGLLGALALWSHRAMHAEDLRQTIVSLGAAGLAPVGWLVGRAASLAAAGWSVRRALVLPGAVLLAIAALLFVARGTIALLGPDAIFAPLAGAAAALAWGGASLRLPARPLGAVVLVALVAPATAWLPLSSEARGALVFEAPCASSLRRFLPATASVQAPASPAPPRFSLTKGTKLRRRWPIVLVTIDSLRPDHTGLEKYRRPTTPNLDALARRSVVFRYAYAVGSSTSFSLPALLTGRFMSQLEMQGRSPAPSNTTFAEVLSKAGYRTAGLLASSHRGLGQGFEQFRHSLNTTSEHTDREMVDEAIEHLGDAGDRPLLLWLHLYDPHNPYDPLPESPRWGETDIDRYDREIWSTDRQLGRLVEAVDRRYGPEGAVIVVSADHGDAFGEHGSVGHGGQLYEELVRVPLVVRVPGAAPRTVEMLASLLDLFPTFLDLAGIEHPEVLEGRSLVPWLDGAPADEDRLVFQEQHYGRATAVHHGRDHLVLDSESGATLLYDLDRDPGELHPLPLHGASSAVAARLSAKIRGLRARLDGHRRTRGDSGGTAD